MNEKPYDNADGGGRGNDRDGGGGEDDDGNDDEKRGLKGTPQVRTILYSQNT